MEGLLDGRPNLGVWPGRLVRHSVTHLLMRSSKTKFQVTGERANASWGVAAPHVTYMHPTPHMRLLRSFAPTAL